MKLVKKTLRQARRDFDSILGWDGHPFQSYECLIGMDNLLNRIYDIMHRRYRPYVYVIYNEDGNPVLIAPIRKVDGSSAEVLGSSREMLDYVDILYGEGETKRCLSYLYSALKHEGISRLRLKGVCPHSRTIQQSSDVGKAVVEESRQKCVLVDIQGVRFEEYFNTLTKHSRQNIRTAYNRARKNGLEVQLKVFGGENVRGGAGKVALNAGIEVYLKRSQSRYGWKGILHKLSVCWSQYPTLYMKTGKGILFNLMIGNRVAGTLWAFVNSKKKALEVPRLAIDDDYAFYSPGVILIMEVLKWMEQRGFSILDFSIGDEWYKLKVGGMVYETKSVMIEL